MSDEFEDREGSEQLGELNYPLSLERGELYQPDPDPYANTGVPGDVGYQEGVRGAEQLPGTISQGAAVTSTYETRPINSQDFMSMATPNFVVGNGNPEVSVISHSFLIPQGRTGVLHGFSLSANQLITPGAGRNIFDEFLTTLFLDGSPVTNYIEMPLGLQTNTLPTEVIGNAGQIFTIQTRWAEPDFGSTVQANIVLQFTLYGQLLLTRGLPTKWETGNIKQAKAIRY